MISVDKAFELIDQHRPNWGVERIALAKANGRRLAENIVAPRDQPPHALVRMDGYAFRTEDAKEDLNIIGESRAGVPFLGTVSKQDAVRVFTGSVLPKGADIVEMQENTDVNNDILKVSSVSKNRNFISPAGSDFKAGDLLFASGEIVSPRMILSIATCNIETVLVDRIPTIAFLPSGDELQPLGSNLKSGQIVNSIAPSLIALLSDWGVSALDLGIVADQRDDISDKISQTNADIIIPIGGASVGKYDHMKSVAVDLGFTPIFDKVAVKPGKPVWFSVRQNTCILGLPGNPISAWVCSILFLSKLLGRELKLKKAETREAIPENGIRETFLRATLTQDEKLECSDSQYSGLVLSFSKANALVRRSPNAAPVMKGASVEFIYLD